MDRRQYSRLVPDSPVFVHVGDYSGRLSDLSVGGLALEGPLPVAPQEAFYLHLDLFGDGSPVNAVAQTAWSSESHHRTGMRFLDLADNSRQKLLEWMRIQTTASLQTLATAPVSPPTDFDFAGIRARLRSESRFVSWQTARNSGGLPRLAGLVLGTVVLCTLSGVLCYRLGARSAYRRAQPTSPPASSLAYAAVPKAAPEPTLPSAENPAPSVAPLDTPGLILQVGAMSLESNADALSESLQKKDFPAFVFKRGSDRFYKVAVGPFADRDSAAAMKGRLEQQSLQPILRPWSPE